MSSPILVYKGLGANSTGIAHMVRALNNALPLAKYDVQVVSADDIIKGARLESAALLVFGAGYTTGLAQALGEQGILQVRDFVLSGGSYLGTGAGGYFGCDFIEFDKGGPLEKFSERKLRFYPGIGRGPVYPGFQYGTNQGVHAAPVTFVSPHFSASFYAYIDGGCAFIPSHPQKPGSKVKDVQVLSTFTALQGKPAAVVKTVVGEDGMTVLSGVHLEYDAVSVVDSDTELEALREDFTSSTLNNETAFKSVLKALRLDVNENL